MQSLAVKYRPKTFDEVVGQQAVVSVLKKQLETGEIMNSYLFIGNSGCGKTTLARILCNEINQGKGSPIEIDAASHNGVEDARDIVAEASTLSIDSKYKVFIIDECQRFSKEAWDAMLKTIEEPPMNTIFMFCTTELNKVPQTIKNRCFNYSISKISLNLIKSRLQYICNQEGITITDDALHMIACKANGSMRQAIAYVDNCKYLSSNIDAQVASNCLGMWNYQVMFDLTAFIITKNVDRLFKLIDYVSGIGDVVEFINEYVSFILQLATYTLTGDFKSVELPQGCEQLLTNLIATSQSFDFMKLMYSVLDIKLAIRNDLDAKTTVKVLLAKKALYESN